VPTIVRGAPGHLGRVAAEALLERLRASELLLLVAAA
jgi:proteasome assembly chaperone (PAC2) family protein